MFAMVMSKHVEGQSPGRNLHSSGRQVYSDPNARDPALAHFFILMLNNSLRNVSGKDFEPSRCSNAEAAAT